MLMYTISVGLIIYVYIYVFTINESYWEIFVGDKWRELKLGHFYLKKCMQQSPIYGPFSVYYFPLFDVLVRFVIVEQQIRWSGLYNITILMLMVV